MEENSKKRKLEGEIIYSRKNRRVDDEMSCYIPDEPDPVDFNEGIVLPSLIKQLRSILDKYPDDGQILKEIIQNAEDAGASRVIFLIDNTTYGTDVSRLQHKGLVKYQGPALYAYNDAVFRYADWKGIRMFDNSVKADDPLKIGRFGLGFKSVFHMTDLPSIFSSKGIGYIDPLKECFEYQPPDDELVKTTAFFWHLDQDRDQIARLKDQFEPFMQSLFGVTSETFQSKFFNGTVFRFPFRTAAITSRISKTTYDRDKVLDLVHSLEANAHHMLLFLRKIQCVEVYEKTHDGNTVKLLDISIEESYRKMMKEKLSEFKDKINVEWREQLPVSVTYPIAMNVEIWNAGTSTRKTNVWLVSQYYAGAEESPAVTLSSDKGHLPLVGVALPIEASSGQQLCDTQPEGHVFCFLPLPLEKKSPTGLRFHVNGNFAVDQNRRHIKWPSADRDTTRLTDDAHIWNHFLVKVVLPKAAIKAIAYLAQLRLSDESIPKHFLGVLTEGLHEDAEFVARLAYSMIPNVAVVTPQWKGLSEAIYLSVWTQSFFHTLHGEWIKYRDAIFEAIDARDSIINLIRLILCADKVNLVNIPRYVKDQLPYDAKYVTPVIVHESLRNVQYRIDLKDEDRRELLEYLLEFSKDSECQKDLVGLILLPLEDGTWTEFETSRAVRKVYVASREHPQSLLPGLEGRLLRSEVDSKAIKQLIEGGVTQLKYLNSKDFREMIGDVFSKWQRDETVALGKESWFARSWLTSLWKYLQEHFRDELHPFEGLHILPLGDDRVGKLSQQLPLVSMIDNFGEDSELLCEEIAELCHRVGVMVVKDMEQEVLRHTNVWNTYILRPNACGVLTALLRLEKQIGSEELIKRFKGVPDNARKLFRDFIGLHKPLKSDYVNLLKTLPIFQTVDGSGGQAVTFVSLVEGIRVAPLGNDIPLPSQEILLDMSEELSYLIAKTVGVNPPTIPDHIMDVYFPAVLRNNYNLNELMKLMQYVCDNLLPFEKINGDIVPTTATISFVPRQDGKLVKPSEVYVKDELLGKLFAEYDVFPAGEFAENKFKMALLKLGLKTAEAVTPQEVLAIAEKLSGYAQPNQTDLDQAEALMKFLNQHGPRVLPCILSEGKSLLLKLTEVNWVKISSPRPLSYPHTLKFVAENAEDSLVCPNEIFTSEYAYLVGSVRYTIDTSLFPFLSSCFKWTSQPQIHDVTKHLLNTVASYDATQKAEVLCILSHSYKYLNECGNELIDVLSELQDRPWVWHGDGFARTSQLVQIDDHGIDMRPFVYNLPKETAHFHQLWKACSIKEHSNLIKVLQAIKKAHEENDTVLKNKERDLKLAIDILNRLDCPTTDEQRQEIVVPINTDSELLVMKDINECAFSDKEFDVDDFEGKIFLIHEMIPQPTAEKLNIPSLISKVIGAEQLDMEYGQTEPLTRRLQKLLGDYTDGLDVLKELIQNADDAGASEIRFLYDERRNQDAQKSLLDEGMKDLQGPALWTYNDAVFTDNDFDSIVKLSGATKDGVTEKIGRFGLGFNAVYNLTDVPMFISRQFIVIFDPHTTYLGRALTNKLKPGIKLNLDLHRNKIRRLEHQFQPMNGIFGCELGNDSTMKSYKGTLFRFPLRTLEQAKHSNISQVCYNREGTLKLLKLLYDAGHSLLLYTQNVRKITVYHLPELAVPQNGIDEWFSIRKDVVRVLRPVDRELTKHSNISQVCYNREGKTTIEMQCAVLKQATAMLEYHRADERILLPELDISSVFQISVQYGVKFPQNFKSDVSSDMSEWLVVSSLGTGTSLRLALDCKKRNIVPVGGVAARLQGTPDGKHKVVSVDGMLFCFLQLPIDTNLPVHINGFFDVHCSRQHLNKNISEDMNVDWNEALLADAVTRAYCFLLEDLKQLSPAAPGVDFYTLWPTNRDSGLFGRLTESVYGSICSSSNQLNVVKTQDGWTTVLKSKMLSREFRSLEIIGDTALSAFRTILKNKQIDEHVVDIPANIEQAIRQTSSADVLMGRIVSKVQFYKDWFLPNIGITEPIERDQLILHGLSDEEIAIHLKGRNCIPVSPGGFHLRSIDELIHPESLIACLFDADEGRFPEWTSGVQVDSHVFKRLTDLGMKTDDLPWQEILDRCKLITSHPETAPKRTPVLLKLIENKLKNESTDDNACDAVFREIPNLNFLPVMKKPKDFPIKWKGADYVGNRLISCKEGYLEIDQRLVCCSHPIIDEIIFGGEPCSKTKHKLGLSKKAIDPATVVQQVLNIIDFVETTDVSNSELCSEYLKVLSEMYDNALSWLDHRLKENLLDKSTVMALASRRSIKIRSDLYLSPDRCAMRFPLGNDTLLSYLAAVPDGMTSYATVLTEIGVKHTFSLSDYVRILNEIRDWVGNRCLEENELKIVVQLITVCVYQEIKSEESHIIPSSHCELLNEMPIPNAEGKMFPARDLCFNNCLKWLTSGAERSQFCHGLISHEIASALGLKTIGQDILKRHQLTLPFGQRERLVNRIKTILDGYPFSKDIFKEMLQNADDAGAKEIHFILDTRTLPDEKVFEDSWKPLQGPALCIYDDKSFTQSNLDGIQRLGEGEKSDDPTTTGKYGVGFNCVYHLTDVPTFLTTVENVGTVLCAFDPNCKFVPGASSESPGAMFKADENLKMQFVDVFKGFSFAHEQYDVSRMGTMFRLPLRNPATAKASEISKDPVTVEYVEDMFEQFKSDLGESLLFVNSVEKIQLVRIDETNCDSELLTVLSDVEVQMTEVDRTKRTEFHNYVKERAKLLTSQAISFSDIKMKEISYEMKITASDGIINTWQIVKRFGFDEVAAVPRDVAAAVRSKKLGLLPQGGVALLVETTKCVNRTNRLFCFLPLPIPTDLPVHLNGHFALDQNRRNLSKDECNDIKTQWNTSLMVGVVAPAYSAMLCTVRDRIKRLISKEQVERQMTGFYSVFPRVVGTSDSYVNNMAHAVYEYIIRKNVEVLPVQIDETSLSEIEWKHPRGEEGRFIYFEGLNSQIPVGNNKSILREVLVRCGFSMFSCPSDICESFLKAGKDAGVLAVSPTAVLDFFATRSDLHTRCKVMNLPRKIGSTPYLSVENLLTLLDYCAKTGDYKRRLEGMPFLVTLDDVVSQFDSRMVKYVSEHSSVTPHIPGQFMKLKIKRVLNLKQTSDVSLCKEFTVDKFALALRDLIKKPEFYDAENYFPIAELDGFLNPYNTDCLHWLREVWTFLSSFLNEMSLKSEAEDKKFLEELLKPLSNCCLLPVLTLSGETLLYPLCLSSGVIAEPTITNESCNEVVDLLYALGVARPDYSYIHGARKCLEIDRLLRYSLGTVQQPATVVEALRIAMKHQLVNFTLTNNEGLRLLEYFSVHIGNWKNVPHARETIRILPFFLTFWNKQTNLDSSTTYVLPLKIPSSGTDGLIDGQDIRLLKCVNSLRPLLEYLGCKYLDIEHSYLFILKHFKKLSRDAQLDHLKCLKQHVLSNLSVKDEERNAKLNPLLECLKHTDLIPSRSNVLSRASEFYDPQNVVFQVMREGDRFPPHPYSNTDWLQFLRMCGLVHEVTRDTFLSYAQQVERNGQSGINELTVKQSETLVKHFLNRNDHRQMDLELVRNIRFVSPGVVSESLGSLHAQYGSRDDNQRLRFICFSGASLHSNEQLVWTVQNLLPQWISSHTTIRLFSDLNVVSDHVPPITVTKHVQTLCSTLRKESLASDRQKAKTLTAALQRAFAVLYEKGDLDEEVKNVLSRTCCVFVADSCDLVAPNQVAIDIITKDEIRPYLFKIPMDLGSYTSVLLQLGTTTVLTANQYAFALKKIADASQGKEMHPEEMKASCRATEALLGLLVGDQALDGEIFLPCTDKKLHKSSEVIFCDKMQLLRRLSKLDRPILIDSKDLNLETGELEDILKTMHLSQRPRFLSEIAHEILADGEPMTCAFADEAAERFGNPVFRRGLERLFRHCFIQKMRKQMHWTEATLEQRCKQLMDRLDGIEFIGRVQVQTYLECDGIKVHGSDKVLKYFRKKSSTEEAAKWTFYISADAWRSGDERHIGLYRDISRILNDIVKPRILDEGLLYLILDCHIRDIQDLLDSNYVTESGERSFVPPLGCCIPQEYLDLLIQDNFIFYPGQLVALEMDDPVDKGDLGEPVFILVEILERQDPYNEEIPAPLAKYRIRVSHVEERIVNALMLYAFNRYMYNVDTCSDQSVAIYVRQEGATNIPKQTPKEPPNNKTLREVVEEIKTLLKDAWKGTLEDRKKMKRRLYLQWHPDKNAGKSKEWIELCTEACKILQHLLELLEKGKSIDDYNVSDGSSSSSRSSRSDFDDFYHWAGERARYYNQRRNRSSRRSSERRSWGFYSSRQEHEDFFTGFRKNRNPQPGEARRWMRQAWHDFGSAVNDRSAFDWMCLKCFEVLSRLEVGCRVFCYTATSIFLSLVLFFALLVYNA